MIAYLQQYCGSCKDGAVDVELAGTAQGEWLHMVRQPLVAHDWGCKDRVSLMLTFHHTLHYLGRFALRQEFLDTPYEIRGLSPLV